jgi:hypothetical protein
MTERYEGPPELTTRGGPVDFAGKDSTPFSTKSAAAQAGISRVISFPARLRRRHAFVESVNARPGEGTGVAEGVLATAGIPCSFITPAELPARNRMRRQRLVEHLHRLGPSPLGHFIREVEASAGIDVTARLERYAQIDPEFVRALNGHRFAHSLVCIDESKS